jgi:endonuclease YncB( thermonuclease family)
MAHDFKQFPELTNSQMQIYYFQSPHKQITESIKARVIRVIDGDTIRVEWQERDFDFPVRMAKIAAPELNEHGGKEAQSWLESQILGEEVDIIPTKTRVEKWGRLLANVEHMRRDMSDLSLDEGHSIKFEEIEDHAIKPF